VTRVAKDGGLAQKGLLRHASIDTGDEFYIGVVPEETRKATDTLGNEYLELQKRYKEQPLLDAK
jgi:hypothetical protein